MRGIMPRAGLRELINLTKVIASGRLMYEARDANTFASRFEAALASKMGVNHALAINTGTSGLITALAAAGIGPGDEVLVPAYTWVSTAIAPLAVGAVPILVDIDESLTIDTEDLERKITPYTKAIIPVHMLNLVCRMDKIQEIASEHKLVIVEDACQAVGATYKGRRVGSLGDLGVFSFNHYKNMSSGEGGAILANDPDLFERAKVFHDVGSYSEEYVRRSFAFAGHNLRISELTAAVLKAQLNRLDPWLGQLRRRRQRWIERHGDLAGGKLSPHHDPPAAIGLTVIFEEADEAIRFADSKKSVVRIADIKRHDYTSWLPVLQNSRADRRKDPFLFTNRHIEYSPDMCLKTLNILARSCLISLH